MEDIHASMAVERQRHAVDFPIEVKTGSRGTLNNLMIPKAQRYQMVSSICIAAT